MQPVKDKSKTKIVAIIAAIAVALIIIGGAVYAVIQVASSDKNQQQKQSETTEQTKNDKNVTQQTLNQGMSDLDETVKQGKQAHDEAAAAVNDPAKRVKVSE